LRAGGDARAGTFSATPRAGFARTGFAGATLPRPLGAAGVEADGSVDARTGSARARRVAVAAGWSAAPIETPLLRRVGILVPAARGCRAAAMDSPVNDPRCKYAAATLRESCIASGALSIRPGSTRVYIVAIAWIYVVLLMALTEPSIVAGIATFVFYGAAPLALFLWLVGTPQRRRNRRSAEQPDE